MTTTTWMIQGASRGLGLEFVRQLLLTPRQRVIATCRSPAAALQLQDLQRQHRAQLDVLQLDVQDDASIDAVGEFVETSFDGRLDRLVNLTAVLHDDTMRPETRYQALNRAQLMKSMEVNAVGNILVASRMLPCLIAAGDGRGGSNGSNGSGGPAVLANMSARVSSISDNGLGGWYSYRSSKTALNQLTKTLAVEMSRKKHNVSCVLLHPGTCDSDLSRPWHNNVPDGKLFSKERGVRQLLEIIEGASLEDSGTLIAWDKRKIEW